MRRWIRREERDGEDGQILILFALVMVVMIALAGLLYSGAQSLVARRQLQNTGDAAALAAANLMGVVGGCSADNSTTPRSSVTSAVTAAVAASMPNLSASQITVTCPAGYSNSAVEVDLRNTTPAYFVSPIPVGSSSTAFNGSIFTGSFAVALLDPSNPTWTSGGQRRGCASYTVNGGVTLTYEGSLVVDSACTLATSSNGAFKAVNSGFSMTMLNGATVMIVGQAAAGTSSHITPTPTENFRPALPDPLAGIVPPCHDVTDPTLSSCLGTTGTNGSLPTRSMASNGQGQCAAPGNGALDPCPLLPGTYTGGIAVGGGNNTPGTVLLRPGVYFIAGGGMSLKSGSGRILSIPSSSDYCGKTTTNPAGQLCTDAVAEAAYATSLTSDQIGAQWQRDCPDPISSTTSHCGVLIYNAKSDSSSTWSTTGQSDAISNGSQGTILLRAYDPANDTIVGDRTLFTSYKNLVIWQARLPAPDGTNFQPDLSMAGGACVTLSGTVYAPGAAVGFGGSTCGTGGGADAEIVLQFIAWDLTLSGNNNFYFAYRRNAFATPTGYGLIK